MSSLHREVLTLDGGLGGFLEQNPLVASEVKGNPLWSSRLLLTAPHLVEEAHLAFLRAGAEAVTTNTYQASVQGIVECCGLSVDQAREALKVGLQVAFQARSQFLREIRLSLMSSDAPLAEPFPISILRSCGNYGAYLHNLSEYTGKYPDDVTGTQIMDFHSQNLSLLGNNLNEHENVCFETIPNKMEALLIPDLIRAFPECEAKTWVSFSCGPSAKLRNGDSIVEVVQELWKRDRGFISGVGVNCSSPDDTLEAVQALAPVVLNRPNTRLFAYPNGLGNKERFMEVIPLLLNQGVTALGGCCGIFPKDITKLKEIVKKNDWTGARF